MSTASTSAPRPLKTALLMLALDERDPSVVDALVAAHTRLGVHNVLVVHVAAQDHLPEELSAGLSPGQVQRPAALDAAVEDLRARLGPHVRVRGEFGVGDPVEVLEELIQGHDVDLLVLGRDGRVEGAGAAWGPSGRKLMRTVSCSVLVVPAGARFDGKRAVVGLDFSSCSTMALQAAVQVADEVEAVYQYTLAAAGSGAITEAEFEQQLAANARQHFEVVVLPDLPIERHPTLALHAGDSASAVLLERAGEDLLVVGSRGLSRIATVLLGSTAEQLAGLAVGPVLVIRRKGEVLGLVEGLFHR
jgi:nucleotide-binding universal stress UspA family protein